MYAQFDAVSDLDLIEEPLKKRVADLQRCLKMVEANLEKTGGVLNKKDATISKLQAALTEAEDASHNLSIELEAVREKHELEVEQSHEQIIDLQGLVARQCEEIERLKGGEGLDMEAFIDSDAFTNIKDCIEDSTGDELVRRIKEVYPDLDLNFLTAAGPDSPHGSNGKHDVEHEAEQKRVEPREGEQEEVESKTADLGSVSPAFEEGSN